MGRRVSIGIENEMEGYSNVFGLMTELWNGLKVGVTIDVNNTCNE